MTDPRIPATRPGATAEEVLGATTGAQGGLSAAQQAAVDDYVREMTGTVIPEIIRVVEERRKLASLSRQMQLKVGG